MPLASLRGIVTRVIATVGNQRHGVTELRERPVAIRVQVIAFLVGRYLQQFCFRFAALCPMRVVAVVRIRDGGEYRDDSRDDQRSQAALRPHFPRQAH